MTTINTPAAVTARLQTRTTRHLIEQFILTGKMIDAGTDPEIYTVRGWIMDELERRDPEAFDAWLDSDEDDDGLPKYFNR
jgi:hypothetical protein